MRARAELKHGFFGAEMVHPTYKVVNEGAPLPPNFSLTTTNSLGLSIVTTLVDDLAGHVMGVRRGLPIG